MRSAANMASWCVMPSRAFLMVTWQSIMVNTVAIRMNIAERIRCTIYDIGQNVSKQMPSANMHDKLA